MSNERRPSAGRIVMILVLIAVAGVARLAFAIATDSSTDLELRAGLCITGSSDVENVPCGDPLARYRLVKPVLPLASFRCDPGHRAIRIEQSIGRYVGSDDWCVEDL